MEETILYRTFTFGSNKANDSSQIVKVIIPESLSIGYNQFVWPCASVLAKYVYSRRSYLTHRHVLELGCGTSLPGIIAAKLGAMVTLTDLPACLKRAHESCRVNGLTDIPVLGITWGIFNAELLSIGPVDVILGSDCFYDTKDFEPVRNVNIY